MAAIAANRVHSHPRASGWRGANSAVVLVVFVGDQAQPSSLREGLVSKRGIGRNTCLLRASHRGPLSGRWRRSPSRPRGQARKARFPEGQGLPAARCAGRGGSWEGGGLDPEHPGRCRASSSWRADLRQARRDSPPHFSPGAQDRARSLWALLARHRLRGRGQHQASRAGGLGRGRTGDGQRATGWAGRSRRGFGGTGLRLL